MDIHVNEWNESYMRNENHIFFPKEEVVKFLSRHVKKPISINNFIKRGDFPDQIKALDYGCGIGGTVRLLDDFQIQAYGKDISEKAIEVAKDTFNKIGRNHLCDRVSTTNGYKLDFENNFFDILICDSVMDSMSFDIALTLIKEFDRVTKDQSLLYLNFISSGSSEEADEKLVESNHEKGTIQSYFNVEKIKDLLKQVPTLKIIDFYFIECKSQLNNSSDGRYYLILKK